MRGTSRLVVAAIAGSTLVACAAVTGLDQITEDGCAPSGCPDGAITPDVGGGNERWEGAAAGETGGDSGGRDSGAGDAGGRDVGEDRDVPADAVPEAVAESSAEAGGDANADANPSDGEAGPVDAVSDAQPISDSGPDSPCGTVYLHETFDGNSQGWTLDSTWSIAPTCANPPAPQKGYPDPTVDHTTSAAGGVAAAYACGNNPPGATSPARYATSRAVDVSAAASLKLAFYRWLNSDAQGWMTSTVDVFDGSAWVNVYTNPAGSGNIVADSAWTRVEYDVTAYKNTAFRVRFGYAVTATGVYAMSCWNVDDLTLSTASCP
jgi:hypothetical protein